ncbi:MAG: hypothetical protein KDD51_02310, partial [Bdellovibrionales bacterium]|nr:hypothetical protein [Bdellovibrionales bacterium]
MNLTGYISRAFAALLFFAGVSLAQSPGSGTAAATGSPTVPGHAGPVTRSGTGEDLASLIRQPLPAGNTDRAKALQDRVSLLQSAKKSLDTDIGNLRALDPSLQEQELTKITNQHGSFVSSLGEVINPAIPFQQRVSNLQTAAGTRMGELITQYQIELVTLEKQRGRRERNVDCSGELQNDPDGKNLIFADDRERALDLFGKSDKAKEARKTYLNSMSRYLGDVIKNCDANSKLVQTIKERFPRLKHPFRNIKEEDFSQNLNALIDSAMLILDFEDKDLRAGWGDQLILRGEESLDRFADRAPVELAPTLKKRLEDIQKNPRLSVHKDARTTLALLSPDSTGSFRQFLNFKTNDSQVLRDFARRIGANDPFHSARPVVAGQHFTKPTDIAARLYYGHSPKALETLEYRPSTNREDARKQLLAMLHATKKPDFAGFFPSGNKPQGLTPLSSEDRAAYRRVIEKALAQVDGVKEESSEEKPYIVQLTEEQTLLQAAKDACENDVEGTLSDIADFVAKSSQQPLPPSARIQLLKTPRSYRVLLAALSKQLVRDKKTIEQAPADRREALVASYNIENRQKQLTDLIFTPSLPKLGAILHAMDWKAVFDLGSTAEAYADFSPYREGDTLTLSNKEQIRQKIITRILAAMETAKQYVDDDNPRKSKFACADSNTVDLGTLLMSVLDDWHGSKALVPAYLDSWKNAILGTYSRDFADFMQELNLYHLGKFKPNDPSLIAEKDRARRRGLTMDSGDRVRFLTRHELTEDDKKKLANLKNGALAERFRRENPAGYQALHANPTRYGIDEATRLYGTYKPYPSSPFASSYRQHQFARSNGEFVDSALRRLGSPIKYDEILSRFGDYYLRRTGQKLHHALQSSRDTLKRMHEALLKEEQPGVAGERRKRIAAAVLGKDYDRLSAEDRSRLPLWDFFEYVPQYDKITLTRVLLEDKYDLPTEFAKAKGNNLAAYYKRELPNAPADVLALLPELRARDLVMLQEILKMSTKEDFAKFLASLTSPQGTSVDLVRSGIKRKYLEIDPWYLEDQIQGRRQLHQGLNTYLKEKNIDIKPEIIENLSNYSLVGLDRLKRELPEEEYLRLIGLLSDGVKT